MSATKSTVEVLDRKVGYRRFGSGEPLVFLAGAFLTNKELDLYAQLAEKFDVIIPDLPGMGDTETPVAYSTFADVVIHFDALFDALGLTTVNLVGHGFGGWVAAEVAAAYPGRLRSLTLLAPWGLRPDEGEPLVNMFRQTEDEELLRFLGDDLPTWREFLVPNPADLMADSFQERTAVARVAWNPRYDIKLEHYLSRVKAPAAVLIPENDDVVSPSVPKRYAEALHTSPVTISSTGTARTEHLFILQEPAQIVSEITAVASAEARS